MKFSGHHPMTKWAEMFEDDTIYWVRSGELVDQISDPMKSGVGPRSCTVSRTRYAGAPFRWKVNKPLAIALTAGSIQ